MRMVFLAGLIDAVTEKGRRLLRLDCERSAERMDANALIAMADRLLSVRGEASGTALARALLDEYADANETDRLSFLELSTERFGPDQARLAAAVESYKRAPGSHTIQELHAAAEPKRQELIRRLNQAPDGTRGLVQMREDLLDGLAGQRPLHALNVDFLHLFASWFNRGFLVLHRVDWTTPANVLEKIIQYEAVHEIRDWPELRRRIEPTDRRCFAFFHPQLTDEPLIFVEVALTREMPQAIEPLLDPNRIPTRSTDATTAVFYSISNCQRGLAGVSFGNLLIKQVVDELKQELPNLTTFVTLSPVPGFSAWLSNERRTMNSLFVSARDKALLDQMGPLDAFSTRDISPEIRQALTALAAVYFLRAKTPKARPVDPVARFHLGNGARLERINWMGDVSRKGLTQSAGFMVNYLYDLPTIVDSHEAFANHGAVHASGAVRKLLPPEMIPRNLLATTVAG